MRTAPDWRELRALAQKATPGEWRVVSGNWEFHERLVTRNNRLVVTAGGDDGDPNLAYIAAASPTRVLALLAELDRLREALADIRDTDPASGAWDGWREVRRLRDIAVSTLSDATTGDAE